MKHIEVKAKHDDAMEVTIGKSKYSLNLRDFDEIVMKVFVEQKRELEDKVITANTYKETNKAMIELDILSRTLEKITHALFVKCLNETYNHYKSDIDTEFQVMSFSEFLSAIGIEEG